MKLLSALQDRNIDKSIADFIREDIDVDSFDTILSSMVAERMKATGYIPSGHQSNEGITKDQWGKMSYSEKSKLFATNPELAQKLMKI